MAASGRGYRPQGPPHGAAGTAAHAATTVREPPVPYRLRRRARAWASDAAVLGLPYLALLSFTPLAAVPRALSNPASGALAAVLAAPFSLPGLIVFGPEQARASAGPAFALAAFVCLLALYHALFEGFAGATPGQRRQGLAPRIHSSRPGGPIGPRRGLWRALARPVDGLLFGGVGAAVALTHGGRRLGDLVAGTVLDDVGNLHPSQAPARPSEAGPADIRPFAPPGSIEEAKRRAGEEGERALRAAFAPMAGEGFALFFGLANRAFGDVDLLMIGRQGVFVIDAKSHRGNITQDPDTGVLLRSGVPFPEDVKSSLRRQATHVCSTLFGVPLTQAPDSLYAFLCFTRAAVGAPGEPPPGGYVFALDELPSTVRARPARLSYAGAEALARKVEAAYGQTRYRA